MGKRENPLLAYTNELVPPAGFEKEKADVHTLADMMFLGKRKVLEIRWWWVEKMREYSLAISHITQSQRILHRQSREDVRREALKYDLPVINDADISITEVSEHVYVMPTDPASRRRPLNSTTFNVCGWCKHAYGGSKMFNMRTMPNCMLLVDAGLEVFEWHGMHAFDDPCVFADMSERNFVEIQERYANRIDSLIREKASILQRIYLLEEILEILRMGERRAHGRKPGGEQ